MCAALTEKELGVVQAVLQRYNQEWLPELLKMKTKVDGGAVLNKWEVELLAKATEEAVNGHSFAEKHPDFRSLIDRATQLYDQISARDKANRESLDRVKQDD